MEESQILYEDNHLLVINKKVGQLVQGDKTGDESLLDSIKNFIKIRDQKPEMFSWVWFIELIDQLLVWSSMQNV